MHNRFHTSSRAHLEWRSPLPIILKANKLRILIFIRERICDPFNALHLKPRIIFQICLNICINILNIFMAESNLDVHVTDLVFGNVHSLCNNSSVFAINGHERHRKTKSVTFTRSRKETRKITKLFKDTQIKISFRVQNAIQNIITQHPRTDKQNKSSTYQMKCLDCPLNKIHRTNRQNIPN
jgi:hypothetical protein